MIHTHRSDRVGWCATIEIDGHPIRETNEFNILQKFEDRKLWAKWHFTKRGAIRRIRRWEWRYRRRNDRRADEQPPLIMPPRV